MTKTAMGYLAEANEIVPRLTAEEAMAIHRQILFSKINVLGDPEVCRTNFKTKLHCTVPTELLN